MDPDGLGIPRSMIVLGKHSGHHALKHWLEQYGVRLEEEELNRFAERFKEAVDADKFISDSRWLEIRGDTTDQAAGPYTLMDLQVISNRNKIRAASVILCNNRTGAETVYAAAGAGPVEAVISCIKQAIPLEECAQERQGHREQNVRVDAGPP